MLRGRGDRRARRTRGGATGQESGCGEPAASAIDMAFGPSCGRSGARTQCARDESMRPSVVFFVRAEQVGNQAALALEHPSHRRIIVFIVLLITFSSAACPVTSCEHRRGHRIDSPV